MEELGWNCGVCGWVVRWPIGGEPEVLGGRYDIYDYHVPGARLNPRCAYVASAHTITLVTCEKSACFEKSMAVSARLGKAYRHNTEAR